VPVSYLRKVNQIKGDLLQVGDVLVIPMQSNNS
jgi:LysM repeat protein